MHPMSFGGRAPPRPTGRLNRFKDPLAVVRGSEGINEGRQKGKKRKEERKGRKGRKRRKKKLRRSFEKMMSVITR